jgi:hypothetical protein
VSNGQIFSIYVGRSNNDDKKKKESFEKKKKKTLKIRSIKSVGEDLKH